MVDSTLLGDFLLAFILVSTTLATSWSTQARGQRREIKRLRAKFEIYEAHLYDLRALLAHHGIERPPIPKALRDDDADDKENST